MFVVIFIIVKIFLGKFFFNKTFNFNTSFFFNFFICFVKYRFCIFTIKLDRFCWIASNKSTITLIFLRVYLARIMCKIFLNFLLCFFHCKRLKLHNLCFGSTINHLFHCCFILGINLIINLHNTRSSKTIHLQFTVLEFDSLHCTLCSLTHQVHIIFIKIDFFHIHI